MESKLTTIDPNQGNIPDTAIIQRVISENDRLPNGEHDKAVKAFYVSDSIASGIGKDFAFVEKIPQLISDIIDNKSWECLYVSRGVVTPYYCRYNKDTDSENFRAFITAKRPNGLGTTIETIDRLLEADLEVRNKFRAIIYQSIEQERDELGKYKSHPSGSDFLTGEITDRQQRNIRAANRAAEAIPAIRELLDRGLIAIDIAAKLGRDIKDPNNLTAEEREYVDKRDLIGLRINKYINTNTIPEDEDFEPAYRRQLNEFVKDLLGIKNRSKSVRMDNPKKAAEKLLQFYQGDKLKELLDYLGTGLAVLDDSQSTSHHTEVGSESQDTDSQEGNKLKTETSASNNKNNPQSDQNHHTDIAVEEAYQVDGEKNSTKPIDSSVTQGYEEILDNVSSSKEKTISSLTLDELAERLEIKPTTISSQRQRRPETFSEWTRKKDPDNIAWERSKERYGRAYVFLPIQDGKEEVV